METSDKNEAPKKKRGKLFQNRTLIIWALLTAGVLVVAVFSVMGYSIQQYKKEYYASALRACDIMAAELEAQNQTAPEEDLLAGYLPDMMNKLGASLDINLYLFDTDGACVLHSSNISDDAQGVSLTTEMLRALEADGTYQTDHAAGKFDPSVAEPMLCRGTAVTLTQDGEAQTYYLFALTYTRPLNAYTTNMIKTSVFLLLALLVIWVGLVAISMRGRAQNMRRLTESMRQYAKGDYATPIQPAQYAGTQLEELATLAETLGDQARRAEESSRQFVSNVSHELRTPMTIITGFVDGILDGTVPKNRRMEYLSIVSQEMQRLKMLVTSMLNLTKFDAGTIQLNYRPFLLNDLAFRIVLMFSNRLEKRHVEVEGLDSEPVRVCADPDLMSQVMYNLVENAVKFVNDGGTISFRFADTETEWVFAVRNTGNGISQEELPKIFERFYKSDASRSQDKTGLGLGLDITRRILHLHHAQISVRSEEHVYTEFEVRLPHVDFPEPESSDS